MDNDYYRGGGGDRAFGESEEKATRGGSISSGRGSLQDGVYGH